MWTATQAWASDYYWRELWSKNVMRPQNNRSQQSSLSLNTEINTRQILGWLPVRRPSSLLRQTGKYQHRPGASMMHFPPISDFPYFRKIFGLWGKFFTILRFPKKFLDFHPPKFLMTCFLVIDHKF